MRAKKMKEQCLKYLLVSKILIFILLKSGIAYADDKQNYLLINSFEKKENIATLLQLYKEQLSILSNLLWQFFEKDKKDLSFDDVKDEIDYVSVLIHQLKIQKELNKEFLYFQTAYRENTSLIYEDSFYPFKRNFSTGFRMNLLKNGIFEYLKEGKFYDSSIALLTNRKIYPLSSLSKIGSEIFKAENTNRKIINYYASLYEAQLLQSLENISSYDKYYLRLINLINSKFEKKEEIQEVLEELNLYNFCVIDEISVNTFFVESRQNISKLNIDANSKDFSFLDRFLTSNLKIFLDYNYRDFYRGNMKYFTFGFDLDFPIIKGDFTKIDLGKFKFLEEKRRLLFELYNYEKDVKDEISNQYQNLYNYKVHLSILRQLINEIEKELKLAESNIKDMDLENLYNLINRAYNEVQLINIYYNKALYSFVKVKIILKNLGFEGKICKE